MKGVFYLEQWIRRLSWFGIAEITLAMNPLFLIELMLTVISQNLTFIWVLQGFLVIQLAYSFFSLAVSLAGKVWSRKLGLKRYFLIPIPRTIAVVLLRGRMPLPKDKRYFMIHVRINRSHRSIFQEMREDIEHGFAQPWADNSVIIGNTFGSFGARQWKQLHDGSRVTVIEGTFLPGQTWSINTKRYQRKMFGRVFSKDPKWKIVKIERGEAS